MTNFNTMKKGNSKVPGFLPPPPKTEIDGKITDLSSKTIPELIELRDRQVKLLNNQTFMKKLADKGAKIQAFHDRIVKELKGKQEEEQTCHLLNQLNLNKQSVQQLEWEDDVEQRRRLYLDSDDDSDPEDVLEFLRQRNKEKQVKVLPPETPLVTPADLLEIGELPHIKYIVEKTETGVKNLKRSGEFKPYRTTISGSQDPLKEIGRKKPMYWEVTSATPPPSIHGPAKVLSIEESLTLQRDYNHHLKEIETQHAAERLLARTGIKIGELPQDKTKLGTYREAGKEDSDDSDPEGSDKEVHDEEPERGGKYVCL